MTIDVSKEDLVNMRNGSSPSIEGCLALEKRRLMTNTGNQYRESWEFNKTELMKLNEEFLYGLYKIITESK